MYKVMLLLIGTLLVIMGCSNDDASKISKNASQVKQVLEDNLTYSEDENMDKYLETIVDASREDTKKQLEVFFKDYDITYELLDFKVIEESNDRIVIEAEQRATASFIAAGESYRDHIAHMEYVFVNESDGWKIASSTVTKTNIIK
ncbi:hypothetical protein ACW0KB_11605 [Virgibacillus salarius]